MLMKLKFVESEKFLIEKCFEVITRQHFIRNLQFLTSKSACFLKIVKNLTV